MTNKGATQVSTVKAGKNVTKTQKERTNDTEVRETNCR